MPDVSEWQGCVTTATQRVRRAVHGTCHMILPTAPAEPPGTSGDRHVSCDPPSVRGLQCWTPVSSHVPVRVRGLASTKRSTPVAVDVIIIITPPAPLNQAWRWCQQWCVMRSTWWCRKGVLGVHCGRGGLAACKIHNASRQRDKPSSRELAVSILAGCEESIPPDKHVATAASHSQLRPRTASAHRPWLYPSDHAFGREQLSRGSTVYIL